MRKAALIILLAFVSLFTACSFRVQFIVVNDSDQPIEVRYQVDEYPDHPIQQVGYPAIRSPDYEWRRLDDGEFKVDFETGTITVCVRPKEALLVRSKDASWVEDGVPPDLSIKEIDITGAYGEITLRGRQVSSAFVREGKYSYALTYK